MGKHDLFLMIDFDQISDSFCYESNIKEEKIVDVVENFLRLQIGKGADESEAAEHDLYEINIVLDLSFDTFSSSSNCGNKGLRDGILMYFLRKIKEKGEGKLVLHHDDPPCEERLDNGICLKCKLTPDMQSTCLWSYCPSCDVPLKNTQCPTCKKFFEKEVS